LVRYDVVYCLRRLFDETGDGTARSEAAALIADEPDAKNAQKMRAVWRDFSH
jgi:predicted secreted protein